jgi:hypothetical protein
MNLTPGLSHSSSPRRRGSRVGNTVASALGSRLRGNDVVGWSAP